MQRYVHLYITGYANQIANEYRRVAALAQTPYWEYLTGLIVYLPHPKESREMMNNPLVLDLVQIVKERNKRLFIGCNAYVSWAGSVNARSSPARTCCPFDATHWTSVLAWAKTLALHFGGQPCINVEIYGKFMEVFEQTPLEGNDRERVEGAMAEGVDEENQVMLARPGRWWSDPTKHHTTSDKLAVTTCEACTYGIREPWELPSYASPAVNRPWMWGTDVARIPLDEAITFTTEGLPGCVGQDIWIPHELGKAGEPDYEPDFFYRTLVPTG